jgi:hypothetical protein
MRLPLICAAAAAAALASSAGAQVISGRVTDRTFGFPLPGVVVSAVDANGQSLARAVTDSLSGYRILRVAGSVKLEFRRIGYALAEVALADTATDRIDVALSALPQKLPPVKAMQQAQCDDRADAGDALALWEQARSGMLTSLVARESKTGWLSIVSYRTSFDGDDEQPRAVERIEFDSASNAFFAGAKPEFLADSGYGTTSLLGTLFLGPDDVVLFDDSFLETHCFSLGDADDTTLTLKFEPAKKRKMLEIAGTVRFRRSPLELESVQYDYVNVKPPLDDARPGGAMYFEHMPSGITMIQRWHIRGAYFVGLSTPAGGVAVTISGRIPAGAGSAPARATRPANRRATVQATETGAMIELMQWPDAPPFIAKLATVSGVLTDKYTKRPLTNTPIRLYRTPYETKTDSTGAFSLVDVLPGVYEADAGDFALEQYGAAPPLIGPVAIKYGPNSLALTGEGPEAVVVRACGEKGDGRLEMPRQFAGKNAIFGQVTFDSRPVKQADLRLEVTLAGAVAGTPAFPLKGKTDKQGRFRICGLPGGTVALVARLGDLSGTTRATIVPGEPYQLLTVKLAKPEKP